MDKKLERILPLVQKPARYTGGEYGEIQKDKSEVDLRMALCFPDTYEIGMSNTGMRILYQVLNDLPGVWCERVFAPWFDMDRQMREKGLPLYALESGDPLSEFDAIGFSLGYEMAYTTVLEMLDLAGIPLRSAERTSLTPLVFAGGSVCCNSEPMADFFDLMRARAWTAKFCSFCARRKPPVGARRNFSAAPRSSAACTSLPSIRRSITATARSRPCTPRRVRPSALRSALLRTLKTAASPWTRSSPPRRSCTTASVLSSSAAASADAGSVRPDTFTARCAAAAWKNAWSTARNLSPSPATTRSRSSRSARATTAG